jgi:hypothetical protein
LIDHLTIDFELLRKQKGELRKGILRAQRDTVTEVGREAELALEAATAAAGMGKLAKAWTRRVYPARALANDPVAMLYAKGGARTQGAIRAAAYGGRIAAKDGGMLAIPTAAAALSARNRRPSPAEWERATGIKLAAVERPGKPTLLVAHGVRVGPKTGRVRAASDNQLNKGTFASAIIFVLVPVLHRMGRFSIEGTVRPFQSKMASEFARRAGRL